MYIDLLCGIVSCSSGSWAPLWVRFMGQSRSRSAVGKSVIRMCASRIRPWVTEPGRKNDEAQGIKDEWPIPTQCNPNQASSITPTITSTYFKFLWLFFFFRLQFHFGSQPWQLWQSRWEPGGSTCKLDYNNDFQGLAIRNWSAGQSCCVFRYLWMLPHLAIADFITEFVLRTVAKSARFGGAS